MKRILIIIAVSLAFTTSVMAQGLKVVDFKLLETDLTANTHGTSKEDQNGETAALIKIVTPERGFTFDGGSLGIVATEEHPGEIWLYVPRRAQKLIIRHQIFGVMRDFFYPIPIEGARTYEMLIDIGTGRYATITTQVANANVYIDGENCGEAPLYNKYLNYGKHTIRAIKDRYEGQEEIVLTTADKETKTMFVNVNMRDMSDHFGNVNVTVDNQADIWFEGRNVGTGSWQTQLREGTYVVETRKTACDPEKTSFTVVAQKENNIKAAPPSPHTGLLHIYTRPRDVNAVSNGTTPIDLTEAHTLPIGTYQLALSRKGYVPRNVEYTVNHNEATRDTITLDRVKYIKPNAFYFGAGYSIRQMDDMPDLLRNFPVRFQAPQHLPRGLGFRNNLRQRKGDRKRAQNCCSTSGGLTGIHLQISKGDIPPFQHTADIVQERAIYHELALPCIQPHDLCNLTGNIRHLFVMVLHLRADQVHGIAEGRHNISFCSKLLNHFITSSIIFFL